MNPLVISFLLHNRHYCGIIDPVTTTLGFGPTHRAALRNFTNNPQSFWRYREFFIRGYGLDLLNRSIIKGTYRFRKVRKHLVLTCPELLL